MPPTGAQPEKPHRVSRPAGREIYRFDGGLVDYVRYLNADKTPLHEEPIYLAGQREDVIFRVAIQYTDSYTENVFSYVNNIPTAEGGKRTNFIR